MTELKIGVIGIPGKWSTEALADAIEARTGFRRVIDMGAVALDLVFQIVIQILLSTSVLLQLRLRLQSCLIEFIPLTLPGMHRLL